MTFPSLAAAIAAILSGQAEITAVLSAVESISPAVLQGPEQGVIDAVNAALAPLNLANAQASVSALVAVIDAGKGPVSGAPDATLS